MEIEVLTVESAVEGSKGFFDASNVTRIVRRSVDDVSASLGDFCRAFATSLDRIEAAASGMSLSTIELSVDITAKGEVRLVAAASVETKGSVKLVFSRRP